jgi:hypothetical protein
MLTGVALIAAGTLIALTPANYPACPTEDSTWCVWHADTSGNGLGSDVVNLWDGAFVRLSL